MTAKKYVAVLGGGSFGTVLANIAASNGYEVRLWVRDADQALRINSEGANATYHPELKLSDNITADDNLASVVKGSQYILVATPSIIFEEVISRLEPLISPSVTVISCTKGIKPEPFRTMTDIIKQHLGHVIGDRIGALSGPNLAKEIAEEKVAGTVIASGDESINIEIKSMLSSKTFKVFSSHDIQGVELAGALKNIYAYLLWNCSCKISWRKCIGIHCY
jgi:glycerol-3-phosphate dehydrogenase (NAD(P)+)